MIVPGVVSHPDQMLSPLLSVLYINVCDAPLRVENGLAPDQKIY